MTKSVTVNFDDGSSHTYDNVPDDVTQEQVNQRAASDYPDKEIETAREGAHPFTPNIPPPEPEPTSDQLVPL